MERGEGTATAVLGAAARAREFVQSFDDGCLCVLSGFSGVHIV